MATRIGINGFGRMLIPIGLRLGLDPALTMLGGLILFGVVFALNSSVHSYLVLAYSEADRVSLSVGFYYMANACGRLLGTLLSGLLYQRGGVAASLWGAVVLAAVAGIAALFLPPVSAPAISWAGGTGDD
jgi:predicted MFS family arabinose efflux permease